MKRHYRIPLLLCSLCTASLTAVAQNTTNLPTSMYGVGELSAGDGGRYAGMGNTGIALNRTGFLNTLNPAAITRMDTACFTFDVGVSASYARYSFLSEHSSISPSHRRTFLTRSFPTGSFTGTNCLTLFAESWILMFLKCSGTASSPISSFLLPGSFGC